MESADEFTKDSIQVGNLDIDAIHEHAILKKNEEGMTLEINGMPYQVSNRDYKETKKDDPNTYVTTTILLDCNAIDTVRVEVEEGWTNKDKTIKILTLNNKENYKYYLSERSMKPLKSDSQWGDSNTYERDLGTYYAFVKTDAGEISDPVKVIVDKIDRVAPTCELEVYEGTISSYGIYKTDAKIRFKEATDGTASATTSGVKSHGIGSFTGSKTVTDSLTGEIENTYIGHIQDNAGNTNTCEITVKSDGISPTVTYNLASGSYSTTQNVVITPSDEGHGLDYYNIKVTKNGTVTENKTNLTASTYTVTMSDNGKYVVATKVIDKANNSIKQTPLDSDGYFYREYIIDKVTPTVTLTAKKKTSGTTVASGVWSNEGLNFTLTAGTVGYSGATIYYCKDTANTCTPSTKATSGTVITSYNSTTGTYYIRYKIVSGAGLSSAVASYTAKVDTSGPTITSVAGNPTNWTNQNVTLTINATDTPSGLHATPYSFDNGATWQASSSKAFSSNQTVNIVVRDIVGNTSSKTVTINKIDKVAPTCTQSGSSTTWTNTTRTIYYGCSDSASGCDSNYDGGSKSFSSTTKTSNIAAYTIKDNAGNTTNCPAKTVNVYVDTTNPTCTNSGDSTTWTNTSRTISYGCSDSNSGCNSSYNGGSKTFTSTTKTSTISSYTIKDIAGNSVTCSARTANVYVDTTNPTCTNSGDSTTWTNASRTIYYGCSDSNSGCNSSYSGGSQSFTSTTKTANISSYTIKDIAGNSVTCSARTANVYVDTTNPTCINSGDSTTWTKASRTIYYGCSDSNSGCNSSYSGGSQSFTSTTKTANISSYTIKDIAGNSVTCSARTANVYVDTTSPTCSAAKSNTGKTTGVTSTVSCSDSDSQCSSSNPTGDSGLTSSKTYTVSDVAGNTGTCTVTVTSQLQKRTASCSNCEECKSAGCDTYNKKTSCSECGYTSWSSWSSTAKSYSSKPSNTSTTQYQCVSMNMFYSCKTRTRSCASCRDSSFGCQTYNTSCPTCGCEGWGSWGSWADATSCSAGQSSDHKTKTECQTVYN